MDEVQKRLQAMSDIYQKLQTGALIAASRSIVILKVNAAPRAREYHRGPTKAGIPAAGEPGGAKGTKRRDLFFYRHTLSIHPADLALYSLGICLTRSGCDHLQTYRPYAAKARAKRGYPRCG